MGVTCCCCIPIQAGVVVLAVLGFIVGLKSFVDGVFHFMATSEKGTLVTEFVKQGKDLQQAESLADVNLKFMLGVAIANMVFGALHCILSFVLLKGVTDRKPARLRFWVRVKIVNLIVVAVVLFFGAAVGVFADVLVLALTIAVALVIIVAWEGYYIHVVYKYAGIMECENMEVPMQEHEQQRITHQKA